MLVNGLWQDLIPVSDRALQYGDGVFETLAVRNGTPWLLQQHLDRLATSCVRLQLPVPMLTLSEEINLVLGMSAAQGILKIIISRGVGGRGYAPPENPSPTRILQFHPFPADYREKSRDGVRVMRVRHPLSSNPALAGLKHLNRLDQVLAAMELQPGFDEGLLCDEHGNLIEGVKSNIFLATEGRLITPDLASSGVAGIMRAVLLKAFMVHGQQVTTRTVAVQELEEASEIFVCNSVFGVWPVVHVATDEQRRDLQIGPLTRLAQSCLRDIS